MKSLVFIAIVVVGLSGGRFSDEKGCCLSSKTREKNVCRGRMIELSTEMARVAEVDRGILWDEEGNWPEVLKSRACSRECPVVWPLWNLWEDSTPEVHDSRISRYSVHAQSQFWQSDWLRIRNDYSAHAQKMWPSQMLTKRSAASGDENASFQKRVSHQQRNYVQRVKPKPNYTHIAD